MTSPLDSRQLLAFTILARTGSFTQTARELFLTQSAVSHSIKALEIDFGCRLLDRLGKTVLLTEAGERVLQHADRILMEMGSARSGIEQIEKWNLGRLRIAAPISLRVSLLSPVLHEFQASFPRSQITVEPSDFHNAIEALTEGRADLILTFTTKPDERFQFLPLFDDELVFIVSPSHPWVRLGSVSREEISDQNLLICSRTNLTWRILDAYFLEEGVSLNKVVQMESSEAIKAMVKLNLGTAIMAPWAAQKELQERSLIALPLGSPKLKRSWGILHWSSRPLTLSEETFIRLCRVSSSRLNGGIDSVSPLDQEGGVGSSCAQLDA